VSADDDRDLTGAFRALGGQAWQDAPTFQELTSREALNQLRRERRGRRVALLIVLVAISGVLTARGVAGRGMDYERFTALTGLDLGEVTWEAPSDFLLNYPGRNLLRTVPLTEIALPSIAPDEARAPNSNDTTRRSRS
jgi:hypothetical protein